MAALRRSSWPGDVVLLAVLAALSLGLMTAGEPVRTAGGHLVHGLFYSSRDRAQGVAGRPRAARDEIARLRAQVAWLSAENARLAGADAENSRLRRALGFRVMVPASLLPAEVIGARGGFLEPSLLLSRGASDGVRENLAVVTPEGLVGRVVQVESRTSWVMPLTHPESRVSALVRRSRVAGIVGAEPAGGLVLGDVARSADVAPGDLVVTSGLGGIFPPGWPIGDAVDMSEDFGGLLNRVRLRPRVDFHRLEQVFILLDPGAGPPEDVITSGGEERQLPAEGEPKPLLQEILEGTR